MWMCCACFASTRVNGAEVEVEEQLSVDLSARGCFKSRK